MNFFNKLFKKDKPISEYHEYDERLNEVLSKIQRFGEGYIIFSTNKTCPLCSPYNNRLYSIYCDDVYPPINCAPNFLKQSHCPECDRFIGKNIMFDFALAEHPEIITLNATPIADTRTPEQIEYFELEQLNRQRAEMTKFEYDWLLENLPDLCPKSLSGYSRMKNSNSANFQKIVAAAREKGFDIISI